MKEDESLVRFLRTYRLDPPPANDQLEERLMSQLKPVGHSFPWIKIGMAMGLMVSLLALGQLRRLQTATNTIDYEQLEASLLQSWEISSRSEEPSIDLFNYQEN
ncbi:MAG: hypothetical protein CV045_05020 [Cyanobacteria bacterium M5B4]|nr:hypothetical protein [Cyanobacteria bacterium KgW148]PLS68938.1 MAG: hypothetical protein CV045_05020 [Cyanobacteria bacterium M5B4]